MVNCCLDISNIAKGQRMNRQKKKHIANYFLFQGMRRLALKYNVKVKEHATLRDLNFRFLIH